MEEEPDCCCCTAVLFRGVVVVCVSKDVGELDESKCMRSRLVFCPVITEPALLLFKSVSTVASLLL